MKCPQCAAELEDAARFCGVCGHRVGGAPGGPEAASLPLDTIREKAPAGMRAGIPAPAPAPGIGPSGPLDQDPWDPFVGTTLNGRFLVEEKLGEGGFGAVYRGVQVATGRRVALKVLHPSMTRDGNVVARFRREGQVLCSLRDAHSVTTYDFDETSDGTLFIAMELLEGRSLHEVFHVEAPLDWRRMLKIVWEMCSSLAEAHDLGIVHRDLKPENIHLEERPGNPEFVKILDFGIAKVLRGEGGTEMAPQLTATGQTLGTLEYMSPEQLMGKQLDGRSDIYALGVVLYEMITGRLPFPDALGPAQLISAQLKRTPDAPSAAHPAGRIPLAVDQLIFRMIEKDKRKRFQSVQELRSACEELLWPPSAQMPAVDPGAAGPPTPQPTPCPTPQPSPPPPVVASPAPQLAHTPPPSPGAAPGASGKARAAGAPSTAEALRAASGKRTWVWIAAVVAIVALGGAVGAVLAYQ